MVAHPKRHGPARRWIHFIAVIVSVFALLPSVYAEESGLSWLRGQQAADGGFSATEATAQQTTFEAARAYRALGDTSDSQYPAALRYIVNDTSFGIPFLTQRLVAAKLSGLSVAALQAELLQHQNADGGFGSFVGAQSSVIDTIEALDALSDLGIDDRATVQSALTFLLQGQVNEGGFSHGNNTSSVYLTARAAMVFERFLFRYNLSTPLQNALNYLWRAQSASGWGSDWETALALQALIPATTDATLYSSGAAYLRSRQLNDGSWSSSSYATALALQALYLADHRVAPQEPIAGTITGQLFDGGSGLPISGIQVLFDTGTSPGTVTSADGRFELTGLAPGEYCIKYVHDAYGAVRQTLQVQPGERVDGGAIKLWLMSTSGLLQGTVTALESGLPLAGATLEATGTAGTRVFTSGMDGSFQLVLPPGPITLVVNASGYESETAAGAVPAGGVVIFSPSLRAAGTPAGTSQMIEGRVLDNGDGTPITGVQVAVGNNTTSSGTDGGFVVIGQTSTEFSVDIQAAGYQPLHIAAVASPGGVLNLGDLRLLPEVGNSSSISGKISDAESGFPIAGATISSGRMRATSDQAGGFALNGIPSLSFVVTVSAPGYSSRQYPVTLAQPGKTQLSFALTRSAFGGVDILGLTANQVSPYAAYSPVRLAASLKNTTNVERSVRLRLKVLDAQEMPVEEFTVTSDPAMGNGVFAMPADATIEAPVQWYTGHYSPGSYRLWLQVYDAGSSELLAERASTIVVEETRRFEYLRLAGSITDATQGAVETIHVLASIRNRSNVPVAFDVDYHLTDSTSTVIHEGKPSITVAPETMSTTLELDSFEHTFRFAGHYPFRVVGVSMANVDVTEAGAIDVAPNVRIEPMQSIEPGAVVPQGDARLKMKIRIKGVQAP